MVNKRKNETIRYKMTVRRAGELETGSYVITPQHPTGVLLVHKIAELGAIDDGKWIEITTGDKRKHVVNADDHVLVVFQIERSKKQRQPNHQRV